MIIKIRNQTSINNGQQSLLETATTLGTLSTKQVLGTLLIQSLQFLITQMGAVSGE